MYKIILTGLTFVIIFLPTFVFSQVTWQKWYDNNNINNIGNDVLQTKDGGYIFLSQNYSGTNYFPTLIKTNLFGDVEWKESYSDPTSTLIALTISQTLDSGFIISGYSDSAVIFKTSSKGILLWYKKYLFPGLDYIFLTCHSNTNDGGIIACGNCSPPTNTGVILKTDSIGNLKWHQFGDLYFKVIQSRDDNYYFGNPYKIAKHDQSGGEIWSRKQNLIGPNILEAYDYNIYTGAHIGLDSMCLTKIDSSGNIKWQKGYYRGAHSTSMCLSNDQSIIMAGYLDTLTRLNQGNIAISKIDFDGKLIFNKQIFSASGNNLSFLPYAIKSTTDNGFIITGFTNYPRFTPFVDNVLAVKTDSLCNAPIITNIKNENVGIIHHFELFQNFPNPFNSQTIIKFYLPITTFVKLTIFDINGKEINKLIYSNKNSGYHTIQVNLTNLPSGIYFYCLKTNVSQDIKKMLLIK